MLSREAIVSKPAYASVLLVAALSLAIACLAFGAAPVSRIRSRRAAAFVADERARITAAGAVCLVVAGILFALTGQ